MVGAGGLEPPTYRLRVIEERKTNHLPLLPSIVTDCDKFCVYGCLTIIREKQVTNSSTREGSHTGGTPECRLLASLRRSTGRASFIGVQSHFEKRIQSNDLIERENTAQGEPTLPLK
jgi:hypothetical protein